MVIVRNIQSDYKEAKIRSANHCLNFLARFHVLNDDNRSRNPGQNIRERFAYLNIAQVCGFLTVLRFPPPLTSWPLSLHYFGPAVKRKVSLDGWKKKVMEYEANI